MRQDCNSSNILLNSCKLFYKTRNSSNQIVILRYLFFDAKIFIRKNFMVFGNHAFWQSLQQNHRKPDLNLTKTWTEYFGISERKIFNSF